jgi:hypothetical protein
MGSRHPWEITLREFVAKVRRDYGIEVDLEDLKRIIVFVRAGRRHVLPVLDPDEILPLIVLRNLCWLYGLPPLDFHLDPEEEDDED